MKAVKNSKKRSLSSSLSGTSDFASGNPRTVSQNRNPVVSPPTTVELRGVPIHFPFQPYACQKDYMESVLDALFRSENALLESPTGTGKTLCLLCSTLAWQREEARKIFENPIQENGAPRRVPTIIYASRTHSQLSQVVRELRNTRYRPKHAVLGSREQMCVNPKVKKAGASGADINHDCNRLGQDRKCSYRNKLENFTPPPIESGSGSGTQDVRDMEDLVQMGQQHKVCPFYFTRNMVEDAELILVPYNYLFDKDARTTTLKDVPWKNAVVIFDEAHNLESFASESASFDISSNDIAGCIAEIQRAINYIQTFGSEEGSSIKLDNIAKVKAMLLSLEGYILDTLPPTTMAFPGEFMMEVFTKGAKIDYHNHELFLGEIRKLTDVFLQFGGKSSKGAPRLEHLCQCIKRVFGESEESRCYAKAQSYRVHITQKQKQSSVGSNGLQIGRTISYWCFAPSEAMRELANLQVRSILVTSGTLSPLESYALELDLPFPHRLENPHIIPDDQIHVRVIGKGVSNKILSSAYERRQDEEYYTELGNTIISLAKIVPGGMLIFFPSYSVMGTCMEKWGGPAIGNSMSKSNTSNSFFAARKKKPTGPARYSYPCAPHTFASSKENMTPWKRLLGVKSVVVEPRSTADLPDAISEFHKFLNLPKSKGVALFGVCRGKISEGIDFAHDMCRAVLITGLPFAPSFDPKVKMKREFLDRNRTDRQVKASSEGGFDIKGTKPVLGLSGHEWYTQQAHRAVNQAIGRVIRNKNDYGAVLLLDNRFSLPGNQNGLSKWVRPHILPDEGMGRTIGGLSRFYRDAAKKSSERDSIDPNISPLNRVSVVLKYEDEMNESKANGDGVGDSKQVENIAYINNSTSEGSTGGLLSNSCYIREDQVVKRVKVNEETKQTGTFPAQSMLKTAKADGKEHANEKKKALSPAQRFFEIVKKLMTPQEQSAMKHAAVAMRPKNGKFGPEFTKAAQQMVKLILSYEKLDGRSRDNKPEMLMLLLQLLPSSKVRSIQQLAIFTAFSGTHLGHVLRTQMKREEFTRLRSVFVQLLFRAWYKDDNGAYIPDSDFLSGMQNSLSTIMSSKTTSKTLHELLSLVPLEVRHKTQAFLEELEASRRIAELKARERNSIGESSLEIARFRSAFAKTEPVDHTIENSSSQAHDDKKHIALSQKTHLNKLNPYLKQSQNNTGMPANIHLSEKREGSKITSQGRMRKVLKDLESDVFFGKLRTTTKSIQSNAPGDMKCQLCETECREPVMAQCNHIACKQCWQSWLKKAETCPVCRNPAKWESLALLVFKS